MRYGAALDSESRTTNASSNPNAGAVWEIDFGRRLLRKMRFTMIKHYFFFFSMRLFLLNLLSPRIIRKT